MRISITASKNFENIYILRDIYINPTKRKTVIHKALGRMDKLMDELQLDRDGVIQWARNCAAEETEKLLCNDQSQVVFQRYLERASNSIFRALATLLFAHQDESLRRSMVSALSPTV